MVNSQLDSTEKSELLEKGGEEELEDASDEASGELMEKVSLTPDYFDKPIATLSERILAGVVDALIIDCMVLPAFLIPLALRITHYFIGLPILLTLAKVGWAVLLPLAFLGMLAYLVFLPAVHTKTIGQKKIGLQTMVINDLNKREIRPLQFTDLSLIIKRVVIGAVDILPFTIPGLILVHNHPLNQALCDRLTNTIVIAIEEEDEEEEVQEADDEETDEYTIEDEKEELTIFSE